MLVFVGRAAFYLCSNFFRFIGESGIHENVLGSTKN
jgi:hypothetical protein